MTVAETRVEPSRPSSILLLQNHLSLGGTEGQFVEVVCRLDRSRWHPQVGFVRAEGPLRTRLDAAGVLARSCGRGSFKTPRFAGVVLRLASFLRTERIRLVHSWDIYSNILGVSAARLARVPVVIASQRDLGNLRPPLQRRLHNAVLRLADYLVVNTDAAAERIAKAGTVDPRRLVVIPSGVDCARFSGTPPAGNGGSGRITVGTVAMLRPEKGLADFVRAAAHVAERFPEARFVIWGDGLLRPELERLVRDLALDGAVALAGATLEPEVALRSLDIFVLPSLSEGCSNALLEAMATGRPVVATRVGGTPALVDDEVTGLLVPPGDPAALAKAVIRLIEEPGFAAGLAARAQTRVRAEFGIDRMLQRFQALYHQALATRGL